MRQITEAERTPAGMENLAIKTGPGGLMDAEFIAQTICLAEGWHEPNTIRALQLIFKSSLISKKNAADLTKNYRALRKLEHILRRWSYESETVLPRDEGAQYRVAVRCGFPSANNLVGEVTKWKKSIRVIYKRFFNVK